MRISQSINASQADIENKEFNYWIGVSLGNKYFTKDNIQKYIEWSLLNTKDSILVLVADWIYSINLEVLDKRNEQPAFNKAIRLGDTKITEIKEVINTFSPEKSSRIKVGRWKDIESSDVHRNRVKIVFEEFNKKTDFYTRVIEMLKDNFKNQPKDLKQEEWEKLAGYVLHEMPLFLDGIHVFGLTYDAILYPGTGLLDLLVKDLQGGLIFPELTKKLSIKKPAAIIEAYVD